MNEQKPTCDIPRLFGRQVAVILQRCQLEWDTYKPFESLTAGSAGAACVNIILQTET